jgi:hypothetical protein
VSPFLPLLVPLSLGSSNLLNQLSFAFLSVDFNVPFDGEGNITNNQVSDSSISETTQKEGNESWEMIDG